MLLGGPTELCRELDLAPETAQCDLMERLRDAQGLRDELLRWPEDGGDVLRAVLMLVLWRALCTPGSRTTLLAPSDGKGLTPGDLGQVAMAFLSEICKTRDEGLRQITTFRGFNTIKFGSEPGWELRLIPNLPSIAQEAGERSAVALILDAGSSQDGFAGAARALEDAVDRSRGLVLRCW
jgi:hypothetical protein